MEDHISLLNEFNFTNLIQFATQGYSGGIVMLQSTHYLTVDPIEVTAQELHDSFQVSPTIPIWYISLIDASTSYHNRQTLWHNIQQFAHAHTNAWTLCGDFNEVCNTNEKFGGNPINTNRSEALNMCLHNANLIDLGFHQLAFYLE